MIVLEEGCKSMIGATYLIVNFISKNYFQLSCLASIHLTVLKVFFLTNSIIPPPELFLLRRNGELKPSIANWLEGKMDLLLFLRSAKCLIYPEQFLV